MPRLAMRLGSRCGEPVAERPPGAVERFPPPEPNKISLLVAMIWHTMFRLFNARRKRGSVFKILFYEHQRDIKNTHEKPLNIHTTVHDGYSS